jgi:hypothetical protein
MNFSRQTDPWCAEPRCDVKSVATALQTLAATVIVVSTAPSCAAQMCVHLACSWSRSGGCPSRRRYTDVNTRRSQRKTTDSRSVHGGGRSEYTPLLASGLAPALTQGSVLHCKGGSVRFGSVHLASTKKLWTVRLLFCIVKTICFYKDFYSQKASFSQSVSQFI